MNLKQIHTSFITQWPILIITIVVFLIRLLGNEEAHSLSLWISVIIDVGIALLLLFVSRTFSIIRQRSLLPAFFYLLLIGTNPSLFCHLRGSVFSLLIVFCFFFLFMGYQNTQSQGNSFNISLILTAGGIFWPPFFFFFPLFWYGMYQMRKFNIKVFFAGLAGTFLVFLFALAWSVYKENPEIFFNIFSSFQTLFSVHTFQIQLQDQLHEGFIAVLFIISMGKYFISEISEKIRIRIILNYLCVFVGIVFLLFLFRTHEKTEWLSILYIPVSFLIAHYFTFNYKKWESALFLFSIVYFISIYLWEKLL
jgi:hypothetical protein